MSLTSFGLFLAAVVFFAMALVFRRTLKAVEKPQYVLEKPPLPKDLAAMVLRLDKWKSEGRISREDYERLMHLCQEDAGGKETKATGDGREQSLRIEKPN